MEKGKKHGRKEGREELDSRISLWGDINTLSRAVEYTQQHKNWKNNYWHFTVGFHPENQDVSDDTMRAAVRDILEHYFHLYDIDTEVIAHAEAHRPRIQTVLNKQTGEMEDRLLHIHIAVSKLNPATGKQLRMLPYFEAADRAFQSELCAKYGFVDPADRKRSKRVTLRDILARDKGGDAPKAEKPKQTVTAALRNELKQLLAGAGSLEEVKARLSAQDWISETRLKKTKHNKYIQVVPDAQRLGLKHVRNINLRGQGFQDVERLIYTAAELDKRKAAGKFRERKTRPSRAENRRVINAHKAKHRGNTYRPKKAKTGGAWFDYEKADDAYQTWLNDRLKEQRIFYAIYKNNIAAEMIRAFKIWEQNNVRHLVNRQEGIRVYDRGNKVIVGGRDRGAELKGIRLALEVAQAKGWTLDDIRITGDAEFVAQVREQMEAVKAAGILPAASPPSRRRTPPGPPGQRARYSGNPIKAATNQAREGAQERLSAGDISELKGRLDALRVLKFAAEKYKLSGHNFEIINNKINDKRNRKKPQNVIDFLSKQCNIPIREVLPELRELYRRQIEEEKRLKRGAKL